MDYIRLFPENPNSKEIERVVATLRQGGIIIYPTDTLYALGCDALNVRAVERICKLKNIESAKGSAIHRMPRPKHAEPVCQGEQHLLQAHAP